MPHLIKRGINLLISLLLKPEMIYVTLDRNSDISVSEYLPNAQERSHFVRVGRCISSVSREATRGKTTLTIHR